MSFDKYPAYKSSSLKWLGDIPESWELKRLKHLFSLVKRPVQEGNGIVTCFRDGTVTLRSKRRTEGFTNAVQEIGYQGVRAGDLVIHAMDAFAGAIGVSDSDGKSSPVYSVCVPKSQQTVLTEYYGKLLRNMALSGFVASLAKGIRERSTDFRWSDAGEIFLPVPSIHEQTQIARFLDHETAKIDALICEQERLIELLQEKRQAVISHAVTKGLDPNVPMKDSGVEWLGEVPAHWVVTPLKRCSKLNPSKSGYLGSKSIDCTFLPMEKLKTDTIRRDEIRKISEVYDGYTYFEDGDVLFAKVTPCFENRNTALACYLMNGIGFGSSEIFVLRPETGIVGRFLFYRLLEDVLVNYWSSEMTGAGGLKRVPSSVVENFAIALPDRAEQEHICAYLDTAVKKFEELMAEAESAVALLKERRSALISAAVTGKIDVRNWQPPVDESAFDEEVRQAGMEVTA